MSSPSPTHSLHVHHHPNILPTLRSAETAIAALAKLIYLYCELAERERLVCQLTAACHHIN